MADRFVAFPGMPSWIVGPVRRARRRWRWVDTMIRAAVRFDEVNGGRLAAAITYYAFLAVFPLLLLSFSILGFLLSDDAALTMQVETFLRENVPGLPVQSIADARNTAGVIGIAGFLVAGQRWVDCVRSSVRAVWRRNEMPSNYFLRTFSDLVALLGLGAALLISVGATVVISSGAEWLLGATGQDGRGVGDTMLSVLAFIAGMVVNVVAFAGFLAGLPRLRMSFRRVIGPALLGAVGLELLKTVGRVYIEVTESNPAYTVVAGTVGLLVFLNLFDQLLLYCAALTAVAPRGGAVIDRGAAGADEAVNAAPPTDDCPVGGPPVASGPPEAGGDGPDARAARHNAGADVRPPADSARTDPDQDFADGYVEDRPARPDTAAAPGDVVAPPGRAPAEP